ncbi:MAG: SPOR domain-containing protein, partial [Candidatus Zixiibacteriota bacterium]
LDKARIMMAFDKKIAARDILTKLSREKSGPGVAAALYLLTADAAERKRPDDAVFYYNLLREAYPSAIGLDALLDVMAGLGSQTQREKSADLRTGTFYSVQVGVFSTKENAERLSQEFDLYGHKVEISTKKISDRTYYVVFIGRFDSYESASEFEKTIEAEHNDVYQVVAR